MPDTRYFTTWSLAALVGSVVLAMACPCAVTRSVLLAAVANSAAVSVGGPAALGYGRVAGSCGTQHRANMLMHALPGLAVVLIVARFPSVLRRAHVGVAVGLLLALDLAWALAPLRDGARLEQKVVRLYGLRRPWEWAAGFVALQCLLALLVRPAA